MVCSTFFFIHSAALLLMFHRALLFLVLGTNTLVADRTLLNIHSVAHLLHLGLALLLLDSVALLLIRGGALLLIRCHSVVFCVALLVSIRRHVGSIDG